MKCKNLMNLLKYDPNNEKDRYRKERLERYLKSEYHQSLNSPLSQNFKWLYGVIAQSMLDRGYKAFVAIHVGLLPTYATLAGATALIIYSLKKS